MKIAATDSAVGCHRCNTNVQIATSALSLPLLSQRCARFRCNSTAPVSAVTTLYTSASNRVGFLLCIALEYVLGLVG